MNDRNKPELKKGAMSSITRSLELLRAGANQGAERVSSDAKKGSPEVKKTSDPKRRNLCNVNGDSNAKKKIRKISATKNTKPAHEEAETGDSSDEEEILHNVASVASTARPRKKTPIQSSSPDSKNGSENFCDEGSDSDGEKLKDFSVPIIKNEDRESLGQSSHSDSEDENVHEFDWWDKHEDFVDPTLTTHKLRFGVTSDDEEMSGVNNNESVKSKEIKLMISSSVPRNVKYHPMNKNVPWWVDLGNSQIILGDKKSNYYDKLRDETSRRMHINNFDAAHSTDDKERESPTSLEARGIAMIESQGKPDIRSTKEQNSRQCKREADKQEPKDDLGDKMEDRDIQEFEVLEDEKGARIVPQRQVLKENRVSQSEKGEVYASLQSPNGNAAKIEARKRFPPDSSHASMRDTLWKMRMHQIEIKMPYIQAMAEGYAVNARTPFGDKLFTCHRKEWGPHTHLIFRHERDYEEIEEDPTFDFDENSQSNEPWGDCSPDALCCVCKKPAKRYCSLCHEAYYCSAKCQKRQWKKHGEQCPMLPPPPPQPIQSDIRVTGIATAMAYRGDIHVDDQKKTAVPYIHKQPISEEKFKVGMGISQQRASSLSQNAKVKLARRKVTQVRPKEQEVYASKAMVPRRKISSLGSRRSHSNHGVFSYNSPPSPRLQPQSVRSQRKEPIPIYSRSPTRHTLTYSTERLSRSVFEQRAIHRDQSAAPRPVYKQVRRDRPQRHPSLIHSNPIHTRHAAFPPPPPLSRPPPLRQSSHAQAGIVSMTRIPERYRTAVVRYPNLGRDREPPVLIRAVRGGELYPRVQPAPKNTAKDRNDRYRPAQLPVMFVNAPRDETSYREQIRSRAPGIKIKGDSLPDRKAALRIARQNSGRRDQRLSVTSQVVIIL